MSRRLKPALLAGALAVTAFGSAPRSFGQQAAAPEQSCVYMGDVRRTAILDDNNILFYMRNGTIYQNHLRNTCFMLRSANRFTYGSSALRRLCVGDIIQVLPESSFGGAPFPSSCRPRSRPRLARRRPRRRRTRRPHRPRLPPSRQNLNVADKHSSPPALGDAQR